MVIVLTPPVKLGQTYILPASILPKGHVNDQDRSSLYIDASSKGITYAYCVRQLEAHTYLVRVAATPKAAPKGFTFLVKEEQLVHLYPYR
ncbi:hypothetical protein EPA93_19210 [Ktedonosporobacter rubrisoli]|uniref:Uncharacterized protein n=1 Tax=Ktedonosporobacter rubrisoli TaxID=2509675 RepID=A0A4P6JRD0_KTERU|nr:hypothetical protein [Ktedonosporobacter rubrisoli]QBD78009.1 hypothetical protein EPA93_19210 [Ktedonosporobacter rubrisoli]